MRVRNARVRAPAFPVVADAVAAAVVVAETAPTVEAPDGGTAMVNATQSSAGEVNGPGSVDAAFRVRSAVASDAPDVPLVTELKFE